MILQVEKEDREFQDRLTSKPLSREVESRLIKRAQQGDAAAREAVIAANASGVLKLARNLRFAALAPGRLEHADLVQVGLAVLSRCVDTFDPDRGTSFLGYAWNRARGEMFRSKIQHETSLHLPQEIVLVMARVRQAAADLEAEGKSATVQSIAARTGIAAKLVNEALDVANPAPSLDAPGRGSVEPGGATTSGTARQDRRWLPGQYGATAATPEDLALLSLRHEHGMKSAEIQKFLGIDPTELRSRERAAEERLSRPMRMPAYVTALAAERRQALTQQSARDAQPSNVRALQKRADSAALHPFEIPEVAILAALDRLEPKWHARLGMYSQVASARGHEVAQRVTGELYAGRWDHVVGHGFRLIYDQLPENLRPATYRGPVMREACLPVIAKRHAARVEMIPSLPALERSIVESTYVEGNSYSATGKALGVERERVSRVAAKAVKELDSLVAELRPTAGRQTASAHLSLAL